MGMQLGCWSGLNLSHGSTRVKDQLPSWPTHRTAGRGPQFVADSWQTSVSHHMDFPIGLLERHHNMGS